MNKEWDERNNIGKKQLYNTKLIYSKEIINILSENPNKLEELLSTLEMSKVEFVKLITDLQGNIIFYDNALDFLQKQKIRNRKKE